MSGIIKTTLRDNREQFTLDGVHYVGRRVFADYGDGYTSSIWRHTAGTNCILFRLDYSKGDIFVDPALLRPYPDSPIEEPSK